MNADFQELKGLYGVNAAKQNSIMERMRENLIKRNGGNLEFTFKYTKTETVNLNNLKDITEFFEVDGNMNLQHL